MDPTLHQKQGVNHLNKVLGYAPFVAEGSSATVHLTQEDWYVVADTLFKMQTPKSMLPEAIDRYELAGGNRIIRLHTSDLTIDVEAM